MALIAGSVRVGGFIAPTDSEDTYPVTNPTYGLGGLRTVNNLTARNSIPSARREEGMMVYVIADQQYYQLLGGTTDAYWSVFTGGATGGIIIKGPDETFSGAEALEFIEGNNVTIGITGSGITGYINISVNEILGGTFA
jgi:hypothetical protein